METKKARIIPIITVHSIWQHFEILMPLSTLAIIHRVPNTCSNLVFRSLFFFFALFWFWDCFFFVSIRFSASAQSIVWIQAQCRTTVLDWIQTYIQYLNNAYDFGASERKKNGRSVGRNCWGKREEPTNRKENKLQIRFIHCISQYLSQKCILQCRELFAFAFAFAFVCNCTVHSAYHTIPYTLYRQWFACSHSNRSIR